jgi:hypothetical protein
VDWGERACWTPRADCCCFGDKMVTDVRTVYRRVCPRLWVLFPAIVRDHRDRAGHQSWHQANSNSLCADHDSHSLKRFGEFSGFVFGSCSNRASIWRRSDRAGKPSGVHCRCSGARPATFEAWPGHRSIARITTRRSRRRTSNNPQHRLSLSRNLPFSGRRDVVRKSRWRKFHLAAVPYHAEARVPLEAGEILWQR